MAPIKPPPAKKGNHFLALIVALIVLVLLAGGLGRGRITSPSSSSPSSASSNASGSENGCVHVHLKTEQYDVGRVTICEDGSVTDDSQDNWPITANVYGKTVIIIGYGTQNCTFVLSIRKENLGKPVQDTVCRNTFGP